MEDLAVTGTIWPQTAHKLVVVTGGRNNNTSQPVFWKVCPTPF